MTIVIPMVPLSPNQLRSKFRNVRETIPQLARKSHKK